jgi:hypothetical protein
MSMAYGDMGFPRVSTQKGFQGFPTLGVSTALKVKDFNGFQE